MTRVLVLGATGDQGHPLLTRLMDAGFTPVAALRNPDALQGTEFAMSKQCKQIFMTRNL